MSTSFDASYRVSLFLLSTSFQLLVVRHVDFKQISWFMEGIHLLLHHPDGMTLLK